MKPIIAVCIFIAIQIAIVTAIDMVGAIPFPISDDPFSPYEAEYASDGGFGGARSRRSPRGWGGRQEIPLEAWYGRSVGAGGRSWSGRSVGGNGLSWSGRSVGSGGASWGGEECC